jgi:glycosyltransferase involved in cell wall biosynthesis
MSVYNGERYLREAIESILNQTFTDFEFVIINDGSTDSSGDIISTYNDSRIRLINNAQNIGLTKSLNLGLSIARGEYVARQDADDVSHPKRFEKQVWYLNTHLQVVVLGTRVWNIDEFGRSYRSPLWEHSCNETGIRWLCMFESPFAHSSVMMRLRIVSDEYGGYNSSYVTNQDHELWSRIVYKHSCRNLREPLIYLRGHSKSLSSNYHLDQMEKVAATFKRAIFNGLKQEPLDGWIDEWIRINNPRFHDGKTNVRQIARAIDQMHARFLAINEVFSEQADISSHKNRLLLRIAYLSATFDRLGSFALFWRLYKKHLKGARAIMPKYLLVLLLGERVRVIYRKAKWLTGLSRDRMFAVSP